ncbi:MAG: hypothetical protein AAGA77_24270 [Bacteroidota bacterium]
MKKNLFFLVFAIAIFTITTAFILNENPAVDTELPENVMTMDNFGLNLTELGDVEIRDNDLFRSKVEQTMSEIGLELEVKNVIEKDIVTNGEFTSKTFIVQYANDSDEHTVTVSFSNESIQGPIKVVPICYSLNCNAGCNPQISSTGVFSCTACVGPIFSACLQTQFPVF